MFNLRSALSSASFAATLVAAPVLLAACGVTGIVSKVTASNSAPVTTWSVQEQKDKWGEPNGRIGAIGAPTAPTKRPDFPYHNTSATLFNIDCQEETGLVFNRAPNLRAEGYSNGYRKVTITLKIDGVDHRVTGYNEYGEPTIYLENFGVDKYKNASSVKVHVPHFRGAMVFDIDMSGASEAITTVCS